MPKSAALDATIAMLLIDNMVALDLLASLNHRYRA